MGNVVVERAIKKAKWLLVPYLFFLYIFLILDRVNIGFAALKMNKDLGLTPEQFGFASGIFFIGYLVLQLPSNLLLHKVGARIIVSIILIVWGLAATLTGLVHDATQLYLVRFLLGLLEAGFFPGVILYLTYWFPQREVAQAVALFMTGLAVASVLGSPISGIILDHAHWLGLESWRWMFILEGIGPVILGFFTYFILPNKPIEAKFLTQEERESLTREIELEQKDKATQKKMSVMDAMKNGRVWLLAFIYFFGLIMGLYSVSFWLPTIIKGLSKGYSAQTVGFLAMIPFAFAAIMMVVVGRLADKNAEWRYHTQIPLLISAIAMFLMLFIKGPFVSMIVLSFVTAGAYAAFGPFWALPNKFLSGAAAAAGIAVINSIGNLGGFFAPYIIGFIKSKTGNVYYGLTAIGILILISVFLLALLPKESTQGAREI